MTLVGHFRGVPIYADAAMPVAVELPLRIESCANKREHWATRARRTKQHRLAALAVPVYPLPCVVTLIRVAPRQLDDDNLRSGFKALRDGIADRLGVKDNDPRVRWEYGQVRGKAKEYAARVLIQPATPEGEGHDQASRFFP